jgi:hypothetical protein
VCNQVLRATLDTEIFQGPDWRVTISNTTGVGRVMCSRWPILAVIGIGIAPMWMFPRTYTNYDPTMADIEHPPLGLFGARQAADAAEGGQAVVLAPGIISWAMGRRGYQIKLQYVNGWPHTSLTVPALAGDSTINVDDCTGWPPNVSGGSNFGATGVFFDGMQQEVGTCISASVTSGPGTITLANPLAWPHDSGVLFTTMPTTIHNAAIDYAVSLALERGATATIVQSISGGGGDSGGPVTAESLRKWAMAACAPYARVI